MLNSRRSKSTWLVAVALTLTWGLYIVNTWNLEVRENPETDRSRTTEVESVVITEGNGGGRRTAGFVIRNSGCSILKYPTFSRGVLPYLETGKPPVDCIKGDKGGGIELPGPPIQSDNKRLYVPPPFEAKSCCYKRIKRLVRSQPRWADNSYSTSDDCEYFDGHDGLQVDSEDREFLRVSCTVSHGGKEHKFTDFHAFPVPKMEVERRCEDKSSELNGEEKNERLNLIIIGLDATSRLNFHRQMPETRQFLVEMGAVELTGYNKVADNTFPNVIPLMTGHSEKELKKLCWPKTYDPLDSCPWLWHLYEERGYRTMLVEDSPNIGIFNFERLGFRKQPSDYYARPFILAAENKIGHFNYPTVLLCLGPRLATEVVLGYTTKYTDMFFGTEHPSFAFAWSTTMTHDGLALAKEADPVVARHMRRILAPESKNKTAMLFISDHGVRAGEFRQTPQGSQEERLPYAFLVLPPSYWKRYPEAMENLARNGKERLTSPFDLYYTLKDLLTPRASISSRSIEKRSKELAASERLPRGISLFLPVPESRRCEDAGISRHWCTCVNGTVGTNSALPRGEKVKAGVALVRSINTLLLKNEESANKCAILRLAEVMEAKSAGDGTMLVTVKTNPGGAVFEGTMGTHKKVEKGKEKKEETNEVVGEGENTEEDGGTEKSKTTRENKDEYSVSFGISRLNRYGNQSACIGDYHLKLYCYCIDQIHREGSNLKGS